MPVQKEKRRAIAAAPQTDAADGQELKRREHVSGAGCAMERTADMQRPRELYGETTSIPKHRAL